ncbi:hypothetical protein VHEMI02772 [[Torrubiella] hemipterigena]|uniref:Uncharacterized protein n=1 Tax=[Torrubiella] hemipterigena TaxID=1531966 RepID=A0A0A1SQP1_9HYPO|nr:hypothetical protein VHEMI02772 [[Torrubiella] hemipterigena]
MRFQTLSPIALLAAAVEGYWINEIQVPETIAVGSPFTIKFLTAPSPVKIDSVAMTFGLVTTEDLLLPQLGAELGSLFLANQDAAQGPFDRQLVMRGDAKHGETTIRIANFRKQGADQSVAIENWQVNVTIADSTSSKFVSADPIATH